MPDILNPTPHGSRHKGSGEDPVSDATTTDKGIVELATSGENAANVVVQGNDSRLSDSRTPTGSASGDLGGTYPSPTVKKSSEDFAFTGDISPSQITSNQNDYNPTGLSTATVLRLSTDASRNITGLQGGADGRIIIIHNIGSQNIVLKDDDGATSTAGNRFALINDVTMVPDDTAILQYDSTSSRWRLLSEGRTVPPVDAQYLMMTSNSITPNERVFTAGDGIILTDGGAGGNATVDFDYIDIARKRMGFIEDFTTNIIPNNNTGPFVTAFNSGTQSHTVMVAVAETGVLGVLQHNTGTTATGRSCVWTSGANFSAADSMFVLGQGITTVEAKIKIDTLSDGTNTYKVVFGFIENPTTATVNDGVWIEYSSTDSANWRYNTANDATRTQTNSSTAVAADTWVRLKIVVNADASSVEYFVNGSSLGTITTNIPTDAAGDGLNVLFGIYKSVGTTARTCKIDYLAFQVDLTTPR